jgi:hypothetical protein
MNRRIIQLRNVGILSKHNIIGNSQSLLQGISQQFISLAKREQDILRLSMAAKVIDDPFHPEVAAHDALKSVFKDYIPESFVPEGKEPFAIRQKRMVDDMYNQIVGGTKLYYKVAPEGSEVRRTADANTNLFLGREGTGLPDIIMSLEDMRLEQQPTPMYGRSAVEELGQTLSKQFKFDTGIGAKFKKAGKAGAILSAIYMAGNFFRPHQLSNSLNPLDGFTDLGTDIDGNHNAISSNLELDRSLPLDMVNASFSRQAYVRMNKIRNNSQAKSNIINSLLKVNMPSNPYFTEFRSPDNLKISNYTSNVGFFGNSNFSKNY